MKGKEIIKHIVQDEMPDRKQVRDNCVLSSVNIKSAKRNIPWFTPLVSIVVCAMLVLTTVFVFSHLNNLDNNDLVSNQNNSINHETVIKNPSNTTGQNVNDNHVILEQVGVGFVMNGWLYTCISFEDRKVFGLVDKAADGLTADNFYQITEKDLGKLMGVIAIKDKNSETAYLDGSSVYHFASFPDSEKICIADTKNGYEFFVRGWKPALGNEGHNSNIILDGYNINESTVAYVAVSDRNSKSIAKITGSDEISKIITVLRNKEDIGNKAHEQLFADLWYKTYGNKDVFYNGESMTFNESRFEELVEKAHALWNTNQRHLLLETYDGADLYLLYNPAVKTICVASVYYALSENEASLLNGLLKVLD
jgi:hypothetical protein